MYFFLFRLLAKLQSLGTVQVIDWAADALTSSVRSYGFTGSQANAD